MAIIYSNSFSGSLTNDGAQKATPLPALTKGQEYIWDVGFNTGWREEWKNQTSIYITYETFRNTQGFYGSGSAKNASGSFAFPAANNVFNTSSLINDNYKWSVNGRVFAASGQIAKIAFTPDVDVAVSESFLRVVGQSDFNVTIASTVYAFATKAQLQAAVDEWIDDNTAALATYGEINTWNVSAITDMGELFRDKATFNSDISNWDVSNVTNMAIMFSGATAFNQPLNSWNVSSVDNMNSMFFSANSFNQDLNSWNVSSVTNMNQIFRSAVGFAGDIRSWIVSSVTLMNGMFRDATLFNQPINDWDVRNVTDMSNMFRDADAFQQPLNLWEVNSLTEALDFMGFAGDPGAITYNGLDTLYNGWVVDIAAMQSNVTINFGNSTFTSAGLAAKNILTGAPLNWTITDGGQV